MKSANPFVTDLIKQGVLKTPRIIEAFRKINRADFVPPELKKDAYADNPLSIGEGQTISQPYTVAFMIELLQPKLGDKIFEIGFGSGWQTAILAYIISENGSKSEARSPKSKTKGIIYAVERIEKLFEFGTKNISKYNFIKKRIVRTIFGDATIGLKKYAPFDKIIAAASGKKVPEAWLSELKVGGRLVVPIKNSIWLYIKKSSPTKISKGNLGGQEEFKKQEFPGFVFVSLIGGEKRS